MLGDNAGVLETLKEQEENTMIKTIDELNKEFLAELNQHEIAEKSTEITLDTFEPAHPNQGFPPDDFLSGHWESDKTLDGVEHEDNSLYFEPLLWEPDIAPESVTHEDDSQYFEPEDENTPTNAVRDKPKPQSVWKDLLYLAVKIGIILLAFVAITTFVFGFAQSAEPSMSPAIKDGDLVIFHRYKKVGYNISDVIVLEHNGQIQARRVVATQGDIVDITEDGLMINGSIQQEANIYQKTERYEIGVDFPLTVPDGHVFVLADNREGATDSRIYGTVEISETYGKIITVLRRRGI